jgi:EpsI family protein
MLGMGALALLSNWVRVLVIVVAGQMTHMQHPLITKGHYTFGWAVFATCFLIFLWATSRRAPLATGAAGAAGATGARAAIAVASQPVSFVPLVVAAVALVAIPVISYGLGAAGRKQNEAAPVAARHLPVSGWSGPYAVANPSWRPVYAGADLLSQVTYVDVSGRTLEMAEVVYKMQRQGAELVGYGNSLTGEGLDTVSEHTVQAGSRQFNETVAVDRRGQRSVIWSVFDIGGRGLIHPLAAQLWYGAHSMVASPRSALLAYRVACVPTCEAAGRTLKDFVAGTDAPQSETR